MNIRTFNPGEESVIWRMCQRAFQGPPWFEEMTDEKIQSRWAYARAFPGFTCIVAVYEKEIRGVLWFFTLDREALGREKGDALRVFAQPYPLDETIVWLAATITDPAFQRQGIATVLKEAALKNMQAQWPRTLVLTRMRNDNLGIIRVNERHGFRRTGVRIVELGRAEHEYWYLQHPRQGG